MSDVGGLLEAAPVSRAAVLEERYRSRLPETLDDLVGPAHGIVQLPLHVAWSGQTAFNLDLPKACMHMYRIVLAEGQRGDVADCLNRDCSSDSGPSSVTWSAGRFGRSGKPAFLS